MSARWTEHWHAAANVEEDPFRAAQEAASNDRRETLPPAGSAERDRIIGEKTRALVSRLPRVHAILAE